MQYVENAHGIAAKKKETQDEFQFRVIQNLEKEIKYLPTF